MRTARVAVALIVVTMLSACASGDGGPPARSGASVPPLTGSSWNLSSYAGAAGAQVRAATDPAVGTLNFLDDGKVAGSTGCNRFSGTYRQSGADLAITIGLTTAAACSGPAGRQDTAVIAALGKVSTAEASGDRLVLSDAQGAKLLVYAAGLAGLEGSSWKATGVNNGKQAVVSNATVNTITAEFGEGGELTGFGGCNNYSSTWKATEPDGLTIGDVGSTLMACEKEAMNAEQQYFAALDEVSTYQIDGEQLTLRNADGAIQVTFTQVAD